MKNRKRLAPDEIGRKLAPYCRRHSIVCLKIFGSVARNEANGDSDIDLLATFERIPGLSFFGMEDEMSAILGAPVHLLTRGSVDNMSNPYRRESIMADARIIYDVRPPTETNLKGAVKTNEIFVKGAQRA